MLLPIGRCSRCHGPVWDFRHVPGAVLPLPPDTCMQCGAVREEVVEMPPRRERAPGDGVVWEVTGTGHN